jgi:hypothetical protein
MKFKKKKRNGGKNNKTSFIIPAGEKVSATRKRKREICFFYLF